jgi:RHS repeat-associated protein
MKKLLYLTVLLISFIVNSQEADIELSTSQPSGTVSEATNSITLLPGFSTQGNYIARIIEENMYNEVIGNPYNGNENSNWISSNSYDLVGNLTSAGVSYFNNLGKGKQSHSLDIKTGKIWANEVRYDEFGRSVFSTLSAPIGENYGFKYDFIKKTDGSLLSASDIQNLTRNLSTLDISDEEDTLGWYYSESNDSEKYQDITSYPFSKTIYSNLNPGLGLRTLGGNKIKKTSTSEEEWLQSYSFTMPMAQELFYAFGTDYFPEREIIVNIIPNRKVFKNEDNSYYFKYTIQDVSNGCNSPGETYSEIKLMGNEILELDSVYKIFYLETEKYYKIIDRTLVFTGGDDDGETQRFANIMPDSFNNDSNSEAVVSGDDTYECPQGKPYYIQGSKIVVRDVNGVESVVFKSSDGNLLAAARGGNEESTPKKYKVLSPIGAQGYVDIHIPVGCGGTVYFKGPSAARFKIYDLISDLPVSGKTNVGGSTFLNSGMYRIEENTDNHKNINPYVTIKSSLIKLIDETKNVGIEYEVNYYDYSLNYYDKAGRLTSSVQPLGFDAALNLQATREHTLTSAFSYNSLGQLLETTSPDEGTAEFKYRRDGQIRFSQNSKQKIEEEFSYTNYDVLGRPVESGVALGAFDTNLDPDVEIFSSTSKKEQHYTVYDTADNNLGKILQLAGHADFFHLYKQKFIAGNVSKTYTKNPSTTTTWYSYDVYGRVKWMLQNIDGLGVKTIDYEYDFATGQVTKVLYQKYHTPQEGQTDETFIHQYTYNIAGELYKVETSTDDMNYTEQAKYKYYETGALKRVEVAENVQGIDYIYNLNGQLKAINHPSRTTSLDPGKDGSNGVSNDLFGFAIDYYNGDYSRTNTPTPVTSNTSFAANNQYNGNIKATRWSTNGISSGAMASQIFSYNKNNWLTEANFGSATNTGTITPNNFGNYKVSGLEYDINGNIQRLIRNKDGNANNAMDNLTYHYKTDKKNQLTHVTDAAGNVGVNDIGSQGASNYTYNTIGQLTRSEDESTDYIYNASGLVNEVKQNGITRVKFNYNDKGFRVKKTAYTSTGDLDYETYYIRDAAGSSMAIYTPLSGRTSVAATENPIYGASRLGVYNKNSNSSVYQFTDHLGNVRAVASKTPAGVVALSGATDYYPFGMPMPGRQIVGGEPYRYAFQGQEKDPETGKEAFQLRLWDGRIGRWLTRDPMSIHHSPYLGMGNNPIIMVDPNGGYPTPYEAVLLAEHVYGDKKVVLVGGWALSKNVQHNINDKTSGLKGALYQRKLEGGGFEYAYVYAGSVERADWKNNAQQAFGNSEQYGKSLKISTDVSVALRNQELTFIGHSLGGGVANYSSLNTGRSSITFNPAWVSNSSIDNLNNRTGDKPNLAFRPATLQTNYVHRADPLHILQNGSPFANLLLKQIGKNIPVGGSFGSYFNGHSIGNMVKGIRSMRKVSFEWGEGTFDYD